MRIRRGFLNWEIFLICLGAVPLAVQLGALDRVLAADILRLWPLILIGIGLGLLLRFTSFGALGGVVVAGTFGLLFGALFAGGFPSAATACVGAQPSGPPIVRSGTVGSEIRFDVELTCAEMDVTRAPGTTWTVDVAAGDASPTIAATGNSLRLRSSSSGFGPFTSNARDRWQVTLPADAALSANITVNAATARLALGDGALDGVSATYNAADGVLDLSSATWTTVSDLSATLNASSIGLILPNGSLDGNMTLNASSLELCVPAAGVGLQITYDDTLSSHNFGAASLVQSGKTWQSANYPTASGRVTLHVSANVSSITLNPSGGCQ